MKKVEIKVPVTSNGNFDQTILLQIDKSLFKEYSRFRVKIMKQLETKPVKGAPVEVPTAFTSEEYVNMLNVDYSEDKVLNKKIDIRYDIRNKNEWTAGVVAESVEEAVLVQYKPIRSTALVQKWVRIGSEKITMGGFFTTSQAGTLYTKMRSYSSGYAPQS